MALDADVVVAKVDIPDSSDFSQALDSLPEDFPKTTVDKLIAQKPKTLDSALKVISKKLGKTFGETDLDVPLDTNRLIADLHYAARKNNGKINRFTLISHLIKNLKSSNPVQLFRIVKFFRHVVKHNTKTKGIFSRLLPFEETAKIRSCKIFLRVNLEFKLIQKFFEIYLGSTKDFIKELVKYNSETHLVKGLTGQAEPNEEDSGYNHRSGHHGHHGHHSRKHESETDSAEATQPKRLVQPKETPLSKTAPKIGIPANSSAPTQPKKLTQPKETPLSKIVPKIGIPAVGKSAGEAAVSKATTSTTASS